MDQTASRQFSAFRPSWQGFGVYFLGVIVLGGGPLINPDTHISPALGQLLATCFLAFILIKRFTTLYQVTADELTAQSSFPKNRLDRAPIARITRIDLRRAIIQRLLGVAHVHVYIDGEQTPAVKLFGVAQPQKLKQLLLDLGASDTPVYGAFRR
ncbi:hypothetical protein Deba_3150 [Desulfarculus baarsii DSM 2075]|uniref:YdbS-like PH domain-containing protein n=1 Tax=Desulfarculus baarsii (strain ATCC 33931 / DSM 2075 / LMG 7858 / VKM B-1802 / 2st14) TaxID=644282 RepID=E1QLR8_DESB2|nr:PH domain-containing protein [Desulfarculus baarsii]ADK86503.1 hypothetical protein Deba_3150 [Desulfarculus baarsii DSM 2075]